jgi:hypothetical protein
VDIHGVIIRLVRYLRSRSVIPLCAEGLAEHGGWLSFDREPLMETTCLGFPD